MRRILAIAGLLAAASTAAQAQTTAPGSPGGVAGSPFGDGLAGRIVGFGDLPSTSGPAGNAGSAIGGPITTQQANPFAGNSFRPAGLYLAPNITVPGGPETASTLAANGTANGSGAGAAPVLATTTRGKTVFVGGVGPRRLGVR